MARRYTGGLLSSKEQVTDANSANGIFSVQEAGALTAAGAFPTGRWAPSRSLRFRRSASTYLNRTAGTPTDGKKATFSFWIKKADLSLGTDESYRTIYYSGTPNSDGFRIAWARLQGYENHGFVITQDNGSSAAHLTLFSNDVFRDPSAWYHFVIRYDSTETNANSRVRIFVNSREITSFSVRTNPGLNHIPTWQISGYNQKIGRGRDDVNEYYDMYLSEVNFIDGQAHMPSSFGETDPQTGTWIPKRYSGTYGNNGYYLDFRDNTSPTNLALDRSGNGNNWTQNNFSVSGATATTVSFTSVGTTSWTVPPGITSVNYLVVAGGGGGGQSIGGGGGAGGMLYGTQTVVPGQSYTVTIGAGGTGQVSAGSGANGSNSVFGSITTIGGGGGGGNGSIYPGGNGGSGGGAGEGAYWGTGTAGQGYRGGQAYDAGEYYGSGGGGGAGEVGYNGSSSKGGNGGVGISWPVNSSYYAGGGGGGYYPVGGSQASGGNGGGGASGSAANANGGAGQNASGGGGGGGSLGSGSGGNGGSGIVILSYATIDSTYDSMVDVPGIAAVTSQPDWGGVQRGNYAVLSPISAYNFGGTLSNGNLSVSYGDIANNRPTMAVSSGKWYSEITCTSAGGYSGTGLGITVNGPDVNASATFMAAWYYNNGQTYNYSTDSYTSYGASWGTGDVIGVAWDCDNRTVTFYKNGVSQGLLSAGVMYVNENGIGTGCAPFPTAYGTGVTTTFTANYGQRPFAYFPPAGFKSLCSTNLPNPVIKRPSDHFDVKTWTGNGSALTVGTTAKQSSSYAINKSLRFRGSNSATLSRTPSVSGNRKVWTWSAWVKRGSLDSSATDYVLFSSPSFPSTNDGIAAIYFNANKIHTYYDTSGLNPYGAIGPQEYVDTTSWMHIVWSVDAANTRHSVWVNGVLVSTDSSKFPPNYEYTMNNSGYTHIMGSQAWGPSHYFDGYMAEVNFVDGQSLTPSSFGDFDANNNWMPKRYTGTFGTNGFYLPLLTSSDSYAGSFNGTNQLISVASNSVFNFSGNFTAECWVNTSTVTNNSQPTLFTIGSDSSGLVVSFYSGTFYCYMAGTGALMTAATLPLNQWVHVAWVRNGSTNTLYLNGVSSATTTNSSTLSSTGGVTVGKSGSSGTSFGNFQGLVSNFRVTNTAVYTANFTPPTSALTAISGTQLLTLQNATVIDNSTNAFTITNTNSVTTSLSNPFTYNITQDMSGNGNGWRPSNINTAYGATYDSMFDSPADTVDSNGNVIGNYATLNPTTTSATLTNGNLRVASLSAYVYSTLQPMSGKWYWEFTLDGSSTYNYFIGVITPNGASYASIGLANGGNSPNQFNIPTNLNGTVTQPTGSRPTMPATIGVKLDITAGSLEFLINGTVNGSITGITDWPDQQPWIPFFSQYTNTIGYQPVTVNFGQQPFVNAIPSGFKTLNTKNLKDVGSYNLPDSFGNFVNTPDLVWIKNRSSTNSHQLSDSVRGVNNALASDLTIAQYTGQISAFNPNGFQVTGSANATNSSGQTYVGWAWNRGKTPGFDIVNYGGDGVNGRMIPHNLGQAPAFYITKCLTSYNNTQGFNDWSVYHQSCPTYTGNSRMGKQALWLHSILGAQAGAGGFFNTATSTEFSPNQINYDNSSGQSYIAYLWAEVPGFSKFGGYTGNNSNDGPFIYLGFRPRFILLKKIGEASTTYGWQIYDTARSPNNLTNLPGFWADTTAAEASNTYAIDLVSNGFKIRTNNLNMNNGSTFVYAAWAESPFKYANAR